MNKANNSDPKSRNLAVAIAKVACQCVIMMVNHFIFMQTWSFSFNCVAEFLQTITIILAIYYCFSPFFFK